MTHFIYNHCNEIIGGENFTMDMGEKIHNLRIEKGLTLEELGNMTGVGKSTVRKWENGIIANMRRDKILSLSKALNTTPAYLMGWKDVQKDYSLRPNEQKLLNDFNLLNEKGQAKALEDTHNLTLLAAYAKAFKENNPEYLLPKAAHERTDIDVTEEMRRHDDELMENF